MKKFSVIGVTTLMGLVALGGMSGIENAVQDRTLFDINRTFGVTAYADDIKKNVVDYAFYIVTGDKTYLSTKNGNLVVWKDSDSANPAANVKIIKSNGTMIDSFDPSDEATKGKWVEKGTLETGDIVEITAKQKWSDYHSLLLSLSIAPADTIKLLVNSTGNLEILSTGQGQAQVTYNVNAMTPDDPTSNPEYTVVIPTEYKLSDTQKLSAGTIALKDAKDVSKDYAGDQAVKVSVASAKSFKFDNGGEYKLVDGAKTNIPAEITLNKTTTSSVVNAQLTKEGSKTASADMLTFSYTVAP